MKRYFFLSAIFLLLVSCTKEEESMQNESLPSPVDLFQGQYDENSKEISLTWRYGNSSEISHYEFFYSPGQDSLEILDPYSSSYTLSPVSSNKTYLFNIRVVDEYGKRSEARVAYVNTETEK